MKNILLLFISMSVFNTHNILAQISTHVYVNVPAKTQQNLKDLKLIIGQKLPKKELMKAK